MAEVLLAHCNHLYYDRRQVEKMQPYPPLQTLLAASLLQQEGFEVTLIDATFRPPEEAFLHEMEHHQPSAIVLCEDNFNFLTKMCLTRNRELAFSLCRMAKERNIPVLVNSSDAIQRTALYLGNGADYVLSSEIEVSLLETLRCLLRQPARPIEEVRGISFREAGTGKLRHTLPCGPLADLDRFPIPAWHLVDMNSYRAVWLGAHGYFSLNLVASRGCPFRCNWCAKPVRGQAYSSHTPERTAAEMRFLKSNYRPDHVWFTDDIFALSRSWTLRFAEEVERLDARIPFKVQSRCDLMTRETAEALKHAGCAEVWMGAESGSQRVLDAMEKGLRVQEIYEARENLRRQGIRACYFLQFGYPGEDWEDIQSTIKMIRETGPDGVGISVTYPLPGTPFYERVVSELGPKQNWTDSGDLSVMFFGSYSDAFYQALHDAIHMDLETSRSSGTSAASECQREALWARVEELRRAAAAKSSPVTWTSS